MIFSAMQRSTLPPLSAICLAHDITLWPKCKRQKSQKWSTAQRMLRFAAKSADTHRHSCKISQISSRVSFLQQPAVMLVESATARKSVSAGMPSSVKVVGRTISLMNAASAPIPAAVSPSLPLGAMPRHSEQTAQTAPHQTCRCGGTERDGSPPGLLHGCNWCKRPAGVRSDAPENP